MNKLKIVSGGQTGVDRGGLEAAMDLGIERGGWVPKGWRSEDGMIPDEYRLGMCEDTSSNYLSRTRRNVADSHATLIVTNEYPLSGGTLKTKAFCEELMRSHFVVSLSESNAIEKARFWLSQFLSDEHTTQFILNVAGPRESKAPGIQSSTRQFVKEAVSGFFKA